MTDVMTARPVGFAGGTLDRLDRVRNDPEAVVRTMADPRARLLKLSGLDPVVEGGKLAVETIDPALTPDDLILLGEDEDGPLFARINRQAPREDVPSQGIWDVAGILPASDLAHYGAARSLVDWHARHGFCANCGETTIPHKAGWARKCAGDPGCGTEHYPRVDPVTIMLAEYQGKILVGRQHRWAPGRYSALAGFIEPGETIEEGVARELWEEAGIRVSAVRYVMSQPWPFPSSLMIACIADAIDDSLTIDETEIEDAFWVDADGVRAALAGAPDAPFGAPPEMAVARHLLKHWLEGR